PGEPLVEGEVLGQIADVGAALRSAERAPQQPAAPRRGVYEPQQHLHRRGLAGPVGPEEAEDLALGDRQREVADRGLRTEVLPGAARLDGGLLHARRIIEGTVPSRGSPRLAPLRGARSPRLLPPTGGSSASGCAARHRTRAFGAPGR